MGHFPHTNPLERTDELDMHDKGKCSQCKSLLPIETAPIGVKILLKVGEAVVVGEKSKHKGLWLAYSGCFDDGSAMVTCIDFPKLITGWMPLPEGTER